MSKDLILASNELVNAIVNEVLRRIKEDNAQVSDEHMVAKQEESVYDQITSYLLNLGMPANLRGYHFVRLAICMCIEDVENLNYITKHLYPEIAKQFKITSSAVDRAIRTAIEKTWSRGNPNVLNKVFRHSKGNPTNKEFILTIADILKRKIDK